MRKLVKNRFDIIIIFKIHIKIPAMQSSFNKHQVAAAQTLVFLDFTRKIA